MTFGRQDSLNTDSSAADSQDLGAQALEIAKRRQAAAVEVLRLLEKQLDPAAAAHPETVLHAAAWLAGTSLYRSFGYPDEPAPDSMTLSEKANQEWPKLMKVFLVLVKKDGLKLTPNPLTSPYPGEHDPKKSIREIRQEFEDAYDGIMRRHDFDYAEGGRTGAVTCAMLFKAYCVRRKDLDPALAAGIVQMGLIEGTKTAPEP